MLLRLSRLSLWLAAAAAGLALFGPADQRGLCTDIALALGGAAFVLWRTALALGRRIERPFDAVPDAVPLDAVSLRAVEALVVQAVAAAPDLETALHRTAELLRGEIGARAVRVFLVVELEGAPGLCELIATQPAFRAPRCPVAQGDSVVGRALRERRPCIDLPHAAALPVLGDGRAIALLELIGIEMPVDEGGLAQLLAATANALAERGAAPAAASADSVRSSVAAPRRAHAAMGIQAGARA